MSRETAGSVSCKYISKSWEDVFNLRLVMGEIDTKILMRAKINGVKTLFIFENECKKRSAQRLYWRKCDCYELRNM